MLMLKARGPFRRTYTVVDDGPDGRDGQLWPSLARPAVWRDAGPDLQIQAGTEPSSWSVVVDGESLVAAHPDGGATVGWSIDGEGAGLRLDFAQRGVMEVHRGDECVGTARANGGMNRRVDVDFRIDTAFSVRLLVGYIAVRYFSTGYGDDAGGEV